MQELQELPGECPKQQPNSSAPDHTIRSELGSSCCWLGHRGLRVTPQEGSCAIGVGAGWLCAHSIALWGQAQQDCVQLLLRKPRCAEGMVVLVVAVCLAGAWSKGCWCHRELPWAGFSLLGVGVLGTELPLPGTLSSLQGLWGEHSCTRLSWAVHLGALCFLPFTGREETLLLHIAASPTPCAPLQQGCPKRAGGTPTSLLPSGTGLGETPLQRGAHGMSLIPEASLRLTAGQLASLLGRAPYWGQPCQLGHSYHRGCLSRRRASRTDLSCSASSAKQPGRDGDAGQGVPPGTPSPDTNPSCRRIRALLRNSFQML